MYPSQIRIGKRNYQRLNHLDKNTKKEIYLINKLSRDIRDKVDFRKMIMTKMLKLLNEQRTRTVC